MGSGKGRLASRERGKLGREQKKNRVSGGEGSKKVERDSETGRHLIRVCNPKINNVSQLYIQEIFCVLNTWHISPDFIV